MRSNKQKQEDGLRLFEEIRLKILDRNDLSSNVSEQYWKELTKLLTKFYRCFEHDWQLLAQKHCELVRALSLRDRCLMALEYQVAPIQYLSENRKAEVEPYIKEFLGEHAKESHDAELCEPKDVLITHSGGLLGTEKLTRFEGTLFFDKPFMHNSFCVAGIYIRTASKGTVLKASYVTEDRMILMRDDLIATPEHFKLALDYVVKKKLVEKLVLKLLLLPKGS